MPIAITFWIVYQLYLTFQKPGDRADRRGPPRGARPRTVRVAPRLVAGIVGPLVAIASVLALLYFLGLFVSTRLARFVDWTMLKVPLVTTIYQAVRGVFQSLNQKGGSKFKRVVSVAYPHAGVRVPGFVMKSMTDVETGRTILSVFVPFAPLPTSGFVLLVPEDDVVDIGWTANEAMQGVVSGGLSMPSTLRFSPPGPAIARGIEEGAGATRN